MSKMLDRSVLIKYEKPKIQLKKDYKNIDNIPDYRIECELSEEDAEIFKKQFLEPNRDQPDEKGRIAFTFKVKVRYIVEGYRTPEYEEIMKEKYPDWVEYQKTLPEEER